MAVIASTSPSLPGLTRQSAATPVTERVVAPDGRIKSGHDDVDPEMVYLIPL
jgi:hypothetical protein